MSSSSSGGGLFSFMVLSSASAVGAITASKAPLELSNPLENAQKPGPSMKWPGTEVTELHRGDRIRPQPPTMLPPRRREISFQPYWAHPTGPICLFIHDSGPYVEIRKYGPGPTNGRGSATSREVADRQSDTCEDKEIATRRGP